MCVHGYCRISTKKQSIERQIRNIKAESYSGTTMKRPEWNKLYKKYNKLIEDKEALERKNRDKDYEVIKQ